MCDCGCGKCETKSTALVLNESKAPRTILSRGLKYHLDNNIPLIENVYKAGTRKYFDLFAEARSLYSRGIFCAMNNDAIKILTETNLGHFGMSDGKRIPLDYPIKEGTFNTGNHVATFDGNDGYAEVYKQADGSFYIVVGGDQDYDMTATDAKDVAAKLKRDGYTRLQAGELNEELQRPFPQDTPNEFAYLDFKKWAYLKRGKIKKQMQSLQGDGSRIFRAMALVWETWANHKAKEWSKITDPNKFGRALVVMMVKDNLVFDKAAWEKDNRITHIKENDRNVIDMDRVFMHGKDQDEYRKGEREVGNKINKARAKAHFKRGEKIAVVHKVTKNVMPIEDIRQIDTFDTNKYDFAYLVEDKLNESFDELDDGFSPEIEKLIKLGSKLNPERFKDVIYYIHNNWMEGNYGDDYAIRRISKYLKESINENKLLRQTALSPTEWEKAKKLKGFDSKNYLWDKKQGLHLIRKMSEGKLNEEGESWGLEPRQLADSFTFDELEQLYNDKKISKADLNGAKSYLQAWIDQHPTYLPQRDLTSSNRQKIRDKYLNEEEWSEDFGELE